MKKKINKKLISTLILLLIIVIFFIGRNRLILKSQIKEQRNNYKINTVTTEKTPDKYSVLRAEMVKEQLKRRDIGDEKVLTVMNKIERHKFVPANLVGQAYNDNPLPIGYGQTISQPYIVALMTQSLQLDQDDKVLEIGTGSAYQAAVLAELVDEVYTIEIIKELADAATKRLDNLGYKNVTVKHADGYYGWPAEAPFDVIIITAAANHIPPPLLRQLKDGGKLIIPLQSVFRFQTLTLVTKKGDELETDFITDVRFVPLTGEGREK